MPQFLSAAIRESYASADASDDVISTVELNHASFIDGPERYVSGQLDVLRATLEATAPFNPTEEVIFRPMAFDFLPPGQGDHGPTPAQVKIDNVSGQVATILRQTLTGNSPVEIIYREFMRSDLTQPAQLYYGLIMKRVSLTALTASGEIGWREVQLQAFPRRRYTKEDYPGLFVI